MRIFRLVATPVLLLGLLGFLVWGASWGWRALTAPLPTPEPTPCATTAMTALAPGNASVRVLNGGFSSGLATRVGEDLKERGFNVIKITNTDERITNTIVRSGSNNVEAATLVGSYLNEPTLETDARIDGTIDVLVGTDFRGMSEAGLESVPVESGTICLPPSPSASPSPEG